MKIEMNFRMDWKDYLLISKILDIIRFDIKVDTYNEVKNHYNINDLDKDRLKKICKRLDELNYN
jgi:hypothetical protein